jgi:thiosulfate/3-mercaptopyruvate sulfurtransferase
MYTTLIDFDSLGTQLGNADLIIFDVRYDLMNKGAGREAYLSSHIPGAIYVDLHSDLSRPPSTNKGRHPLPNKKAMNELFSELGVCKEKQVVVYDNAFGSFSARLWWMLKYLQHDKVAVFDGGWQHWVKSGGEVSSKNETRESSQFNGIQLEKNLVSINQVNDCELIIDSRDPSRYKGELEPIDQAAGHIPGAKNRFWKNNLTSAGCFKESDELLKEFELLFGTVLPEDAVFYCGSGVTACHNLLAAVHAGMALPRLYAGSWSEWSSTPGKPIATGN